MSAPRRLGRRSEASFGRFRTGGRPGSDLLLPAGVRDRGWGQVLGARVMRYRRPGKRIVKSPRVYFRDSGLLHYFLGLEEAADLQRHPRLGASWEGFAMQQVLTAHGEREAYFYRTQRGAELDLLLLRKGSRWGLEFKWTDAPRVTKSMRIVIDDLGLSHLWVVYPGQKEYPLGDKITALPLAQVRNLNFRAAP